MTKPMTHPENSIKGSLIRPTYAPGLLLEDDDLTAGVSYTRGLTQLLFRSLFGCGVICGFTIRPKLICNGRKLEVEVLPGVGLDGLGNPLELRRAIKLEYDPDCGDWPDRFWVTACYTETPCRPRELACTDEDSGHGSFTRVVSGVRIEVHPTRPDCACSCEPPEPPGGSKGRDCCGDAVVPAPAPAAAEPVEFRSRKGEIPGKPGAKGAGKEAPPAMEAAKGDGDQNSTFDCYAGHLNGDCDCGCDCSCILIGHVCFDPQKEDGEPVADDRYVRRIRPLLVGQYLDRMNRRGALD